MDFKRGLDSNYTSDPESIWRYFRIRFKESKFGLEWDLLLNYLFIFNYKLNLISVRGRIDFKWGPGFELYVRTGSELKLFPDTV